MKCHRRQVLERDLIKVIEMRACDPLNCIRFDNVQLSEPNDSVTCYERMAKRTRRHMDIGHMHKFVTTFGHMTTRTRHIASDSLRASSLCSNLMRIC